MNRLQIDDAPRLYSQAHMFIVFRYVHAQMGRSSVVLAMHTIGVVMVLSLAGIAPGSADDDVPSLRSTGIAGPGLSDVLETPDRPFGGRAVPGSTPTLLEALEVPVLPAPSSSPVEAYNDTESGRDVAGLMAVWHGIQEQVGNSCGGPGVPNQPQYVIGDTTYAGAVYRASGLLSIRVERAELQAGGFVLIDGTVRQVGAFPAPANLELYATTRYLDQMILDLLQPSFPPVPSLSSKPGKPVPVDVNPHSGQVSQSAEIRSFQWAAEGSPESLQRATFSLEVGAPSRPGVHTVELHARIVWGSDLTSFVREADCMTVALLRADDNTVAVTDDRTWLDETFLRASVREGKVE
jgi:hypothetical protein